MKLEFDKFLSFSSDELMTEAPDNLAHFNEEMTSLYQYLVDQEGVEKGQKFFGQFRSTFNNLSPSEIAETLQQDLGFPLDISVSFSKKFLTLEVLHSNSVICLAADRGFPFKDPKTVHHTSMQVTSNRTQKGLGKGHGTVFLRNSLNLYDQIGINKIMIDMPTDIGKKMWLKAGFKINELDFDYSIRTAIAEIIEEEIAVYDEEKAEYLLELLEDQETSFLTVLYQRDSNLFEEIFDYVEHALEGAPYEADLTDLTQRDLFDNYFASKAIIPQKRSSLTLK